MQIFMLPSFPITPLSIDQENECRALSDSGGGYDLLQKKIAANGYTGKAGLRKFSYPDVNPVLLQAQGDLIHG